MQCGDGSHDTTEASLAAPELSSVFDVVEEPVSSMVYTQAVRQVPHTGLTSSELWDEQAMETEERQPHSDQSDGTGMGNFILHMCTC